MWSLLRRNPGAFGAALLLHLVLAVLVLVGVDWSITPDRVLDAPRVVQATLIDVETLEAESVARHREEAERQAEAEAKRRAEAERQAEAEAKRRAEAKRQAEAEAKRRAEAKRQAAAEVKRRAEAERQAEAEAKRRAEAKRQAEAEAKRRAEAKRQAEAEAKRRAEAERQAEAEEAARQAREADLLVALDAERTADNELGIYKSAIRERIRRGWVRQPGMGRGLSCLVEARLIPGGEVIPHSVRVIRSSGSSAFDRSVVIAVYKASPLPVPSGQAFERFRNLRLDFKP